jgi:hypothetical protein
MSYAHWSKFVAKWGRSARRGHERSRQTDRKGRLAHRCHFEHLETRVCPSLINASSANLVAVNEGDPALAGVEVATFKDLSGSDPASHFQATVDWGSGPVAGAITLDGSATYHVTSTRPTFGEDGSYPVKVTITDADPPTVAVNFAGLNVLSDANNYSGSFYIPPDQGSAVGPNHYMEMVNLVYGIYNKNGTVAVAATRLDTFFANAGVAGLSTNITDPRLIYDQLSQRWFAVVVTSATTNNIVLAVSQTSDPTGAWKATQWQANNIANNYADFPNIAVDANGFYISTNNFLNKATFDGVSLTTIPKADLLNPAGPSAANRTIFENLTGGGTGGTTPYSLAPVSNFGTRDHGRVISVDGFTPGNVLHSYSVSNPGTPSSTLGADSPIGTPLYYNNQAAHQPNGTLALSAGDFRIGANSVYQVGNIIWAAHSILQTATTGTTVYDAIRWYKIDESTNTLLQSGTISDPHRDFIYPAIAGSADGNVVIGFTATGDNTTTTFPGAWYVTGTTTGGVTTFGTPTQLANGSGNYSIGTSPYRWGDFSAVSIDPNNPNAFWIADEKSILIGSTNYWGTQVSEIVFPITRVTDTQTVNEPAIAASAASLAAVNEGDAAAPAVEVATFTHASGVEPTGAFTATIDWGIAGHHADAGAVTQDGSGTYHVSGTRPLYVEEGSYGVTVTITEENASTSVGATQLVNEPAIVAGAASLAAVNEGDAAASAEVATFTHASSAEPLGAFTTTIDWGIDGHHSDAGTVTKDGSGTYHVSGTRPLYLEEGSYGVTVSISEDNGSVSVGSAQQVNEPAIAAGAASLAAVNEGDAAASAEVATFTHASGAEPIGDFTTTIDWGIDGHHADPGTVTQDGSGTYHVSGTRPTYAEDGSYSVTVSISEDNGSTSVGATQLVNEPALVGAGTTLSAVDEGDAAASLELATFTHGTGSEPTGDFTATIDWGIAGHHSDPGTVTQDGSGTYHVAATRPVYAEEGSYSVVVSISEDNASTTVTDTQPVNEASLIANGATLGDVAQGNNPAPVEVATFTHANGVEPTGDFTVTID